MLTKKKPIRINVYLPDPETRRAVKMAAAARDVSISEYCLRAIQAQLESDRMHAKQEAEAPSAVENTRLFRQRVFRGRVFSTSSADLIHEARSSRSQS